ncbi:hypothetical protein GCM10022224_080270 [Nonomuraea antimicrobica]|uniref:Uncharacterized protein n=1 Tax=Nonomuraea antimicrobica TaxID=561173 RepID=A0ABP7DCU7_9ACTN
MTDYTDWTTWFGELELDSQPAEPPAPATPPATPPALLANLRSQDPAALNHAYARAAALNWVSRLTTGRHDPLAVLRNAEPVLEFLAAATDDDDLRLRRMAADLQSANDDERDPDDDGAGFALRAAVLYGAMTGTA